jgi:hypothetical protein
MATRFTRANIVYTLLFVFPRSFFNLFDALVTTLTLGFVHPYTYLWKVHDHVMWAGKISKKYRKDNKEQKCTRCAEAPTEER